MEQAYEEYEKAQKAAQKEVKELTQQGLRTEPEVLDEILGTGTSYITNDLGLVDIPSHMIVGTKTAGRITAFSASFLPLLPKSSEFAFKWLNLCAAHLSSEGIHDPIECFEYLGKFYIQEGNKRVSVLRHFGSPKIPGIVRRIMPAQSDSPRIKAYFEFIEFFNHARIYDIQFRTPGAYAKLLSFLGKDPEESWTEREQRTFRAYFQYFRESFDAVKSNFPDLLPEEALLVWLEVNPFLSLGKMTNTEIRRSILSLKEDISTVTGTATVQVQTAPKETKAGILTTLINAAPHVNVAFVHQLDPKVSAWCKGHEEGAKYLATVLPDQVSIKSYFNGNSAEEAEVLLEQAVADGAQVVFTTTPKLSRPTLKAAIKHPKVRFFNCSVDIPYSSVRSYYGRIFEGKFITGAIAGAMANNDLIGYMGSYPTFGVPASINAFALGAQLTNPRAKIELRWSCLPGTPVQDFIENGVQVISNKDFPTANQVYLDHGNYGTYQVTEDRTLVPLGSPVWVWGRFYEKVIQGILSGTWEQGKDASQAVNYWWGMDSGVIDVKLSERLPEGVRTMANLLRRELQEGRLDPFRRKLVTQDGTVISYGERSLTTDELLHMDWLCENVQGRIPGFDELLPMAQPMVRSLGLYRDLIPPEKEGAL